MIGISQKGLPYASAEAFARDELYMRSTGAEFLALMMNGTVPYPYFWCRVKTRIVVAIGTPGIGLVVLKNTKRNRVMLYRKMVTEISRHSMASAVHTLRH